MNIFLALNWRVWKKVNNNRVRWASSNKVAQGEAEYDGKRLARSWQGVALSTELVHLINYKISLPISARMYEIPLLSLVVEE